MGAVVDWRGATRTWCRDKPNVSTTWVHSTETSVRHSKSSEIWPGQMWRISLPMGCDRITCLPLRKEPPDHNLAHCWRVPTHCIPWTVEAYDVYMKRVPTQWNGYRNCLWNCESVPNEQQQQPVFSSLHQHILFQLCLDSSCGPADFAVNSTLGLCSLPRISKNQFPWTSEKAHARLQTYTA